MTDESEFVWNPAAISLFRDLVTTVVTLIGIPFAIRNVLSPMKDAHRENLKLDLEIYKLAKDLEIEANDIGVSIDQRIAKLYDQGREAYMARAWILWVCLGAFFFSMRFAWDAFAAGSLLHALGWSAGCVFSALIIYLGVNSAMRYR